MFTLSTLIVTECYFLEEVSETLDLVQDVLDDVWKMDSYQVYSHVRMRHLMHIIGIFLSSIKYVLILLLLIQSAGRRLLTYFLL